MGATSTTNPASIGTNELQTIYSRKMLDQIKNTVVMNQFAKLHDFPKNEGSLTVRMYRWPEASPNSIVATTEGTVSTRNTEFEKGYVDTTMVQYDDDSRITDVLNLITRLNDVEMHVALHGQNAALKCDLLISTAIAAGLLNSDATLGSSMGKSIYSERFSGVKNTGDSSNDFATFGALTNVQGKWQRKDGLAAATQLRATKTPTIGGKYVAALPPVIASDIRQDGLFVETGKNVKPELLFRSEIGEWDGVRYVDHTNPWIEAAAAYGTYNSAGDIYGVPYFGANAFGAMKFAGGTNPYKPKINILDKPDKSDPKNQLIIIAYIFWFAAKLLQPKWCVLHRCKSSFNE